MIYKMYNIFNYIIMYTFHQDVATPEFSAPSPIRTVIAADFDNSGDIQVFMNNIVYYNMDATNKLFRMKTDGQRVNIEADDIGNAAEPYFYGTGKRSIFSKFKNIG